MLNKLAFGLVLGSAAIGALAQTITDISAPTNHSAYAQDGRSTIARSQYGLCWRTGYWTAADAVPGCDGALLPPVAKSTAPTLQAAPANTAPIAKRCDFLITLENDQTFTFNQAALSNAAKKRIDTEVLSRLASCAKIDIVTVTGHTDRLGSPQYNQKLADKRANAVAAYLKEKGISAPIDTFGAGATQPLKPCDGVQSRKKLIDCLAPNRRVTIETRGLAK